MTPTLRMTPAGKKKKRRVGPESRDRHRLYEIAVQSPEANIHFCDRIYKKKNGKPPRILKEDFCGTAFLSAEWVKKRQDRMAIGVDLDGDTLRWARQHNLKPLGKDASRVTLIRGDVRSMRKTKVDVVVAFNFSYFTFKTVEELRKYFANARDSLAAGGIFVLDIFGGWEAQMDVTDKTRHKGFTYVWDQKGVDPVTNHGLFHIHFKFHGGGGIKRAFVYDWRLWSIPEVRDALLSVGFRSVQVYWEGVDPDTEEGNGIFRLVKRAENCPGWNAFIVAS
ncbi:MAG: class I SAM-dependent methyltransferase [Candidatus Krumholzibacteria bacterium]|nr:class I SAM-dependent methyltransferase [Candidatus Krumholzibacteria bacterium]